MFSIFSALSEFPIWIIVISIQNNYKKKNVWKFSVAMIMNGFHEQVLTLSPCDHCNNVVSPAQDKIPGDIFDSLSLFSQSIT